MIAQSLFCIFVLDAFCEVLLFSMEKIKVDVTSEIGKLDCVLIHTPGQEVENMTPESVHRALYSDILNLVAVSEEYIQLKSILQKIAKTIEIRTLLTEILIDEEVKENLIREICEQENAILEIRKLLDYPAEILSRKLIEGAVLPKDNLTRFISKNRYSLQPLHNFLFTRDASMSLWQDIIIGRMANKVREREPVILEAIFKEHPFFRTHTFNPIRNSKETAILNRATIEGGDLLVAREDVILAGTGTRTSTEGIDFLIEMIKGKKTGLKHIIVQELPSEPESFIHLDMTFTFIDRDSCIVYEPLILRKNKYQTIHIQIDNGKVKEIKEEDNILQVMNRIGFDIKPVYCGGKGDHLIMEREQWHSAANFLALAPGKVIGYERNDYTLENMNRMGFEVVKASDFISGGYNIDDYKKLVITIPGSEMARGGGGPRCLTMPLVRQKVEW